MNTEDLTVLQEGAVTMHELLLTYVEAGFTRAEAMQIVLQQLHDSIPREQS